MSNQLSANASRSEAEVGDTLAIHGSLPHWVSWVVLLVCMVATMVVFHLAAPDAGLVGPVLVGLIIFFIVNTIILQQAVGTRQRKDRIATVYITTAFVLAVIPLIALLVGVLVSGAGAMSWNFLSHDGQGAAMANSTAGLGHAIVGTLEVTLCTAVISIPLGIFTAIYLVEYGRGAFARAITFLVDIMTGIPSIVAGLFAAAVFPFIAGNPGYASGIEGSVALVVLMTPIVVRNTEEMLRLVPNELREASYALGVTKARTILHVVLRTAASGIVSGCVIAVARVIGESAPLLITAGTTDYYNFSLLNNRMMTLPVYVYNRYKGGFYDQAWGGALILVLIVLVLNLIARLIARAYAPKSR